MSYNLINFYIKHLSPKFYQAQVSKLTNSLKFPSSQAITHSKSWRAHKTVRHAARKMTSVHVSK
jgi:hypothetical protein